MNDLPTRASAKGTAFTVADFYEAGRRELALTLLAGGRNMSRRVEEPVVNRPGLALTGFYDHFACRRLQLLGNADMAYLDSLDEETRFARIRALIERGAFLFIVTNGRMPSARFVELASASGAVLMATSLETSVFVHRSAFVLERLGAPKTSIYGTTVEVSGIGVMFVGDPGLGKSETALGLLKRGCSLIADDLTCIRKDAANNFLFASASDSTAGYMEIRGLGIVDVQSLFGVAAVRAEKRLDLVLSFKRLKEAEAMIDRTGQKRGTQNILGVEVPNVIIPVSAGRDLVNLVETAAMQQKLLMAGHDAVEELSERLRRRAEIKERNILKQEGSK